MRILLCFALVIFQFTKYSAQTTVNHSVYFEVDRSELSSGEKERLETFLRTLENKTIENISLTGHTDSDGSLIYNDVLSSKRVSSVTLYFKERGYNINDGNQYGETIPVEKNDSPEGKSKNRRVEISVSYKDPIIKSKDNIQDLYARLEQKKQIHCINTDRDTNLLLDQGTIIHFPANCFSGNGKCITIEAKEIYKKSDMILENLSTTSGNKQLESGGMVFISAKNSKGEELKPLKNIEIFMPTTDPKPDMKMFKGSRDPHNVMDWQGLDTRGGLINRAQMSECDGLPLDCPKCRFFLCRIGRFDNSVRGAFNKTTREANVQFRQCQRRLRKKLKSQPPGSTVMKDTYCDSIRELFKEYNVNNYRDLMLKMNKDLMDSLGLRTYDELLIEKDKQRIREIESNLESGTSDVSNLSYYTFQTKQLGWINCDRFSSYPDPKITMKTDLEMGGDRDCKLVFQKIKSVMPSTYNVNFEFVNIPEKEPIFIVALKYENTKIYLSIQNTLTSKKAPDIQFHEVTIDELKEALKVLDN